MDLMTDFELHRFVLPNKHLQKHALKKDEWMEAGKVQKLAQMLPEMKARGDRVLIFSQFVQVLDILAYVLKTMDMKYLTLTGQTNVNDRQGLVDEFTNDDSITCFLLSTRAGGLGLNLMAANVVIIMDMDFNP
jgi:SWI/SNF-related matrix-associated actin-dependent regulator 1 of chromatin subfamily A